MSYNDLIRGQMLDPTLEPPDEPDPIIRCSNCERGLYEGDRIWNINGDILCDDCAIDMYASTLWED